MQCILKFCSLRRHLDADFCYNNPSYLGLSFQLPSRLSLKHAYTLMYMFTPMFIEKLEHMEKTADQMCQKNDEPIFEVSEYD